MKKLNSKSTKLNAEARTFEQALEELEGRVHVLDKGDLPLEEALKLFEEGVGLVRECHDKLDNAQLRISELTESQGSISERQFE